MFQSSSNREFKNTLIQNKWLAYQNILSESLRNDRDRELDMFGGSDCDPRKYYEIISKYRCDHKYFNCAQRHCMRSAYQYHKLIGKEKILKYDHFKNRLLSKKSWIKEHIWFNVKYEEYIVISGDYHVVNIGQESYYKPKTSSSLKLNGIPVSYIDISTKNVHNGIMYQCKLLHFCFDMSTFCDTIDYLLKYLKKYFPNEVIRYILYLMSIN